MGLQKFSQIGFIFVFSLSVVSCTNDKVVIIESDCTEEVTFNNQVQPIINQTCAYVECHDGGADAPGDFTTYDRMLPFLTEDLFVARTIDLRDMPPNYARRTTFLTLEQLNTLKCWIENDYQE